MVKNIMVIILFILFFNENIINTNEEYFIADQALTDNRNKDTNKNQYSIKHSLKSKLVRNVNKTGAFSLSQIRSRLLYWFYDNDAKNGMNSDHQPEINEFEPKIYKSLNFDIPFYGYRYNNIIISLNGYLAFSDLPDNYNYDYPIKFPVRTWPKTVDPSFIGIFFSKCRIGTISSSEYDQRLPGLYYRLESNLHNTTSKFSIALRERLLYDIREGIINANKFVPKHVIIVTWKNVTYAGGNKDTLNITNTFQTILVTDEEETYAIFNYEQIDWTTHIDAGGNMEFGLEGVPAFVGFNAGDGFKTFEYKPYSQTNLIKKLLEYGYTNNLMGRHIFRIDENIDVGSCNAFEETSDYELLFSPKSGHMFGGTLISITGPCFDENRNVLCRFADQINTAHIVDVNRAQCVQPYLKTSGYIILELILENESKKWNGSYFIETPKTDKHGELIVDGAIYDAHETGILIQWNRLAFNSKTNLIASLWGYKINNNQLNLIHINFLYNEVENIGKFNISLNMRNAYRNEENTSTDFYLGFIEISGKDTKTGFTISLWSKVITLDWYFEKQWVKLYSRNWAHHFCENWLDSDDKFEQEDTHFIDDLPPCPCTIGQALYDKGNYMPDIECDVNSNYCSKDGKCFRSAFSNVLGSEQQCCYNNVGALIKNHRKMYGSRPRRFNTFGHSILYAWYYDIWPFHVCCIWQHTNTRNCREFRQKRRPSSNCVNYHPPEIGAIFGGLHYTTFDNISYTFNGVGEFTIARCKFESQYNIFEIQGRFQKIKGYSDEYRTAHLTAIVAKSNGSSIIEVHLLPKIAQNRYHIHVIADGKQIFFGSQNMKIQSFQNVHVHNPENSKINIIFSSNVGIEIVEESGFMAARIYVPQIFFGNIIGLLGTNNYNSEDEFTLPNGIVLNINISDFKRIHTTFGIQWMLADYFTEYLNAQFFSRKYNFPSTYYTDKQFVPNFIKEPKSFLTSSKSEFVVQTAQKLCGESYQCRFDYGTTVDQKFAMFTKKFYYDTIFEKSKLRLLEDIIHCSPLFAPANGYISTEKTKINTVVHFGCDHGYYIIGDEIRKCRATGIWNKLMQSEPECIKIKDLDDNYLNASNFKNKKSIDYSKNSASKLKFQFLFPFIIVIVYFQTILINF